MPGAFARRSTRRLAMLGGVFVLLAVMLVPPLRALLVQQQEYRDLQAGVAHQEATVADLEHRKQQWSDPAYIEQQSRERLSYVRPGEKSYVVVGADSLRDAPPRGSLVVIDPSASSGPRAWYSRVWDSIQTGDVMSDNTDGAPVSRLDGQEDPRQRDVTTGPPASSTTP